MSAEELKQAVNLIKAGKKIEARMILEPIIVAEPQNIQAWVWEIETRDINSEKIKLMEACLLHNPDSVLIKNALTALKKHQDVFVVDEEFTNHEPVISEPINSESASPEPINPETTIPEQIVTESVISDVTSSEQVAKIRIDPFTEMSEYVAGSSETTPLKTCPNCGELVDDSAEDCKACGHEFIKTEEVTSKVDPVEKPKKKSWYRRPWIKILTFIFLMPIWCIIELSDPEGRKGLRVFAGILLVFIINLLSLVLFWIFTTNSSRANLFNWYQYLTGQADSSTPGQFVQVEGSVQSSGNIPFSLVELQAKVYDEEGNLLGNSTQYLDSSAIVPGSPTHFQLDVTSLASPFQSGMTNPQVLFYDDFSNTASGWQENSGEQGDTTFAEGKYRITVKNSNFDLWSNPGKNYTDSKIEVDTTRQGGPESNRFGVQCRYTDSDNYYFAVISSDGYYGIGKVVKGEQNFIPKNGMQVTDTIYAGSAVNHIRFDCVGTRLTLYINGDYVEAVDDSDLTAGDVGLLAGTFEEKGTKILFDNLVVFQP